MIRLNSYSSNCPKHLFECLPEKYCISKLNVCDDVNDCSSGNDEMNCDIHNKKFHCTSNEQLLSLQSVCNFRKDCPDGEDEENCRKTLNFNKIPYLSKYF